MFMREFEQHAPIAPQGTDVTHRQQFRRITMA
jgi:hypothetical protein